MQDKVRSVSEVNLKKYKDFLNHIKATKKLNDEYLLKKGTQSINL